MCAPGIEQRAPRTPGPLPKLHPKVKTHAIFDIAHRCLAKVLEGPSESDFQERYYEGNEKSSQISDSRISIVSCPNYTNETHFTSRTISSPDQIRTFLRFG
ncbi:hypothetical protein TIN4_98 [Tsukamurella phage TIN4]|uniref:Uncharacterized protein n=2 Tax=Tinduovirus TIN3 TaxID=1982571 RepID=A0A0K0N660_9CAUD|nr:hypothetical protein AVT54_gp027 [Tsukamurella phage TIN3]YP_009604228.1 hypothetical protein FDH87_gp027 [Tsukamurella phage TIN4]AKJ71895.1 hypothetical protein TIN3_98 [Tsukamurella phage TIN3]AKJ72004.1 hypothetical protein TIN4_98 [Tsukamurella phage TIN4]